MWEYLKLLQRVDDISLNLPKDDGMVAHLARYGCLLGCAALETGLKELLLAHVRRKSSSIVTRYVQSQLAYINNPKPEIILKVLRGFDPNWATSFESYIDSGSRKVRESLGSIVGNRNLIAHGRDSDVSFGRLKPWLSDVKSSLEFIENQILKS